MWTFESLKGASLEQEEIKALELRVTGHDTQFQDDSFTVEPSSAVLLNKRNKNNYTFHGMFLSCYLKRRAILFKASFRAYVNKR